MTNARQLYPWLFGEGWRAPAPQMEAGEPYDKARPRTPTTVRDEQEVADDPCKLPESLMTGN